MKKNIMIIIFCLIGFMISGFTGYLFGVQKSDLNNKQVISPSSLPIIATAQATASAKETMTPTPTKLNDFEIKNYKYWINGVPRKESETIYYQGKYFASLDYLAESLGLPLQKDEEHNEWIKLGYYMNEEIIKENFISTKFTVLKLLQSEKFVKQTLGQPTSSKVEKNYDGVDIKTNIYREGEVEFFYEPTDKIFRAQRIAIRTDQVSTQKGITIGSTVENVVQAYGTMDESEPKENYEGFSGNGFIQYGVKDRLWFEMKDGKVIGFGMNPAIG
jgi:hypothetical protein